ncbi:SxtJ family membrane protein [Limibacillus sp. MBR-115]|jgi:hypothetical protein|uniref:SxtJ family membrane protein n=1 Tax=Limibacillus sp. MBR-115 TaxID=3156465 RepID=UPI003393CF8A
MQRHSANTDLLRNGTVARKGHHEYTTDRDDTKAPSEKSFGITFAVVFALLGAWLLYSGGLGPWSIAAFVVSSGFLLAACVAPLCLRTMNLLWLKFGLLLHRIVNPLVMGLLFFVVFTPMGLAMRLFGSDLLRLRKRQDETSYWIIRAKEDVDQGSMTNQF